MSKQFSQFEQSFTKITYQNKQGTLTQRTFTKPFQPCSINQNSSQIQLPTSTVVYSFKSQPNPYCSRCQQMKSVYVCLHCRSLAFCESCFSIIHSFGKFLVHNFCFIYPQKSKLCLQKQQTLQKVVSSHEHSFPQKMVKRPKLSRTGPIYQQIKKKNKKQQKDDFIKFLPKLNYILQYESFVEQDKSNELNLKWNKILQSVKISYDDIKNILQHSFNRLFEQLQRRREEDKNKMQAKYFNQNEMQEIQEIIKKQSIQKYQMNCEESLIQKINKFCADNHKYINNNKFNKGDSQFCTEVFEEIKNRIQRIDIKNILTKDPVKKQQDLLICNDSQNVFQLKIGTGNKKGNKNKPSYHPLTTSRRSNKQSFNYHHNFSFMEVVGSMKKIKSQTVLSFQKSQSQFMKLEKKKQIGIGVTKKIP